MAQPASESSASPMASARVKKPPVRSASEKPPSVSVPATTPVPNRIAARDQIRRRRAAPPRTALRLHIAAEDQRRTNVANPQQRRQREQQRHQAGDGDALHGRPGVPIRRDVHRKILGDQARKRRRHADAERHADHAAAQPEHQRLRRVDADHLRRPRAHALHHRDGIQLLLQVPVHGAGHAHGADHQRDQADQAEERGGAIEARA